MHTMLRFTLALALCAAFSLSASTSNAQDEPTVLFDFEGFGGDVQGWEPDEPPDPDAPTPSSVRTVEEKAVAFVNNMVVTIPAFEGNWLLEAVPNRPAVIPANQYRGMKYTWDTPQDWTDTPLLKLAASMQARGSSSELHRYRIRVISGTGASADTTEMIYDGFRSLGFDDGTDFNTFVNDWEVLEFDLSDYAGVNNITSIETAGVHADDGTDGTPDANMGPWGGLVHLDLVTVEPSTGTSTETAPGLAFLGDVYPNPSTARAQLAVEVERPQQVRATVYDVLGRVVLEAFDYDLLPGSRYLVGFDTGSLATGSYIVQVRGETFATSRRLTVVR